MKEDNVFFLRLGARVNKIVTSNCRGYFYRLREGSAIHTRREVGEAESFIRELAKVQGEWRGSGVSWDEVRRYFGRLFGWDFVLWAREHGEKGAAYRDLWRSLVASGDINLRGVNWWWRPGLYLWLKYDSLLVHNIVKRIRDKM